MLLPTVDRKIRDVERSFGNTSFSKYIDAYDALSMSLYDVEDDRIEPPANSRDVVKLSGLKKIVSDLESIYTEAYIDQQKLIKMMQEELECCEKDLSSTLGDKDDSGSKPLTQKQQTKESLQQLFSRGASLIEEKLDILKRVQYIKIEYIGIMVSIASQNGVINASTKVDFVFIPLLEPIITHKFFATNEEYQVMASVRRLWSKHYLGSELHTNMAERDLSKRDSQARHHNYKWLYHTKAGGICVLLAWAFSECFNNEMAGREIWNDPTFSIFMCCGDFLLLFLMWGVSMRVWRRQGIDFVKLLGLETTEVAKTKEPENRIFHTVSNLAVLYLIVFIVFNKLRRSFGANNGSLAAVHIIPVALIFVFIYKAVSPWSVKKQWLGFLGQVLGAPFFPVVFRDGYIGDLLTSLVRVLIPLAFSITYMGVVTYAWLTNQLYLASTVSVHWWKDGYFLRKLLIPFLTLCPLWIRLMQCLRRTVESEQRWPHMANALKYTSAIAVISFGTFQPEIRSNPFWVLSFVGATLFQYTWDLTQDWGMLCLRMEDPSSAHAPHTQQYLRSQVSSFTDSLPFCRLSLRPQRLMGPSWVYYLVILCNLVLRFSWTLTLLPNAPIASAPDADTSVIVYDSMLTHMTPVLAALEIIRRMVWGFFRLEHEQLERMRKQQIEAAGNRRQLRMNDEETYVALTAGGRMSSTASQQDGDGDGDGDRDGDRDGDGDGIALLTKTQLASSSRVQEFEDEMLLSNTNGNNGSDRDSVHEFGDRLVSIAEFDFITWFLQDFIPYGDKVMSFIDSAWVLSKFKSYAAKIKFIEVLSFKALVLCIIYRAASP